MIVMIVPYTETFDPHKSNANCGGGGGGGGGGGWTINNQIATYTIHVAIRLVCFVYLYTIYNRIV